jgi:hypothetical protein
VDKFFDIFLSEMGPPIDRRRVPQSTIEYYRGKLPNRLLAYWEECGWCGYGDGLFWTVNPQEYEPVLEAWIGDTPFVQQDAYYIIGRSAFGKLYLWGEQTGDSLKILPSDALAFPSRGSAEYIGKGRCEEAISWFFSGLEREYFDLEDDEGQLLFAPARRKLGRLKPDEMYGFVPAVAVSGATTLANLKKVKVSEHLIILAGLTALRVISSPFE